jgi:hypothetical protein
MEVGMKFRTVDEALSVARESGDKEVVAKAIQFVQRNHERGKGTKDPYRRLIDPLAGRLAQLVLEPEPEPEPRVRYKRKARSKAKGK